MGKVNKMKEVKTKRKLLQRMKKEKKPGFLDSLKSQAQSLLNKGKSKDKDVEEGEKEELLESKEGIKGSKEGLEEVVVMKEGEKDTEEDSKEKTDPEKPYSKYLNQAIEVKDSC